MQKKKVLLNRAMFSIRPYESSALTVLTTLFHHFTEAGNYELFVRRGGTVIHRAAIQIGEKGAQQQLNLDLAALRDTEARECCDKEAGSKYALAVNSIMGFYVSQGTGAYTVEISRTEHKERRALDSSVHIPSGDLFAVTLVRPGTYRAVNEEGGAEAMIRVKPASPKDYRPGEAVLVSSDAAAFKPKRLDIMSGHSVVFRCEAPARLRVELVEPAESAPRPRQDMRHTLSRSPGPSSRRAT